MAETKSGVQRELPIPTAAQRTLRPCRISDQTPFYVFCLDRSTRLVRKIFMQSRQMHYALHPFSLSVSLSHHPMLVRSSEMGIHREFIFWYTEFPRQL